MKTLLRYAALAALAIGLTGCGTLLPQRVEFFQKKVKPVPEVTASAKDTERQAAARAALKAQETYINAIKEGSSSAVVLPAQETVVLTEAVTDSLGPPTKPWDGSTLALAEKVDKNLAKINEKLDDYRASVQPLEGKKIENTGLFSIGYFTMWGVILLVLFLGWTALKIYGIMNPVVGMGVNTAGRVASGVLHTGFRQMVAGGEKFKQWVGQHEADTLTKEEVLELFTSAQKEKQSEDVQNVVKNLLPRD